MQFEELIQALKSKQYKPIYLLQGEEAYYLDRVSDYIEQHVLSEDEKAFNQTVLYGKETSAQQVIETAKRFPMMAEHQVVIVKEAQAMSKLEDLEVYASNPQPSTLLVLCHKYKTLDKRKSLYKTLNKNGVVFTSEKVRDYKVPAWIQQAVKQRGYAVKPEVAQLLSSYLGNDLAKISNELEKLMIVLPQGTNIDEAHVEKHIGISKDYNVFELQKALGTRNHEMCSRIVHHFAQNEKEHPIIVTLINLYGYFSKLMKFHYLPDKSERSVASALKVNPYFVKDYMQAARAFNARKTVTIVRLLREYDLKAKGVNNTSISGGELLRELVFKILNA